MTEEHNQSPSRSPQSTLMMYSTTVSDTGYVRHNNQDSSFAGRHFAAVCDGMGGHAGGDTASTIAIRSLAHIELDNTKRTSEDVALMMQRSIFAAHDAIVGQATQNHKLAGMGTTVTALSLVNDTWILAHIGDSRAYLLRDSKLIRATKDHSYVQHLIDTRRITSAEAKNHPKRNVVMRVLGDFDIDPTPDISIRSAVPGDRWLLCSDGLCGVLEDTTIAEQLATVHDPEQCAQLLVRMALRAGSTDNVTAVIVDAVRPLQSFDHTANQAPEAVLLLGGAVVQSLRSIAESLQAHMMEAPKLQEDSNPAQRASQLVKGLDSTHSNNDVPLVATPTPVADAHEETDTPITGEIPVVQKSDGTVSRDPNDPEVAHAMRTKQQEQAVAKRKGRFRARTIIASITVLLIVALTAACALGYRWSQEQYYVGEADGVVTIYQGVPTDIFGLELSHEVEPTTIAVSSLPSSWREQLRKGIVASSYEDAVAHTNQIRTEAKRLAEQQSKSQSDSNTDGNTNTGSGSNSNGNADSGNRSGTQSNSGTQSSDGSGQFGGTEQSSTSGTSSSSSSKDQHS